jgi:cation diffusion facilitator family transporter
MDCPSEEGLIRIKLEAVKDVYSMEFDLAERTLYVFHEGDNEEITKLLESLNLGAVLKGVTVAEPPENAENPLLQRKILWAVLLINFAFFLVEIATGLLSKSMGLLADSLDMLADAFVYGMSLMVVGAAVAGKKKVAFCCGIIQLLLALLGLSEVIRRFVGIEQMPHFQTMIGISLLALIANISCVWLLQRAKSKEAHIKASLICSANDVIVNAGVMLAGLFVYLFGSQIPDLIIGIIVFLLVLRGAVRILKLAK